MSSISIRIRAWPKPARWLEDLDDRLDRGATKSIKYFSMPDVLFEESLKWLRDQPAEYFIEKGVGKKYNIFWLPDDDLKDPQHTFDDPPQSSSQSNFRDPSTYTRQEIIERYGKRGVPDPSNNNHCSAKNYIRNHKRKVTQQDLNFANDHDILSKRGGIDPNIQAIKRRKLDATRAKASALQWIWQMLCNSVHLWEYVTHPDEKKKLRNVWEYRREKWSKQTLEVIENIEVYKIKRENGKDFEPESVLRNRIREWQSMVAEDEIARMMKCDTPA